MMVGQLRVSGFGDVAGVMGDVVGRTQQERAAAHNAGAVSAPTNVGMDHLQTADRMARVMGVTPQDSGASPIQRDLTRFGLFVNQALQLGLTPQQTEQVVREAQTSPDGKLQPETRALLDKQVQTTQNVSWVKARDEVDRLEHNARMLPPEITAYGAMQIPVEPAQSHVRVEPNVIVQPEIAVTVQSVVDLRSEDQHVDDKFDVDRSLEAPFSLRVGELARRLRHHRIAVVIEPIDERAQR
jgi:hypothetical protein